jgi:hypothetical protein
MNIEYRSKYLGPKITFKPGGKAYAALTYAKMKGEPFTSKQLKDCLSGAFASIDNAGKALRVLEGNKCVRRVGENKWLITEVGYSVIMHIGQARKPALLTRGHG